MDSNDKVTKAVLDVVKTMMDRVLITDPFVVEKHHAKKPLYAALVPDEIFKGSHFERRFVTPFGQGVLTPMLESLQRRRGLNL